jgi:broad specificity phosphatase PhoE
VKPEERSGDVNLPVVRHIPTKLNAQGISRSWLRVPPDPEKLEELGPGIADKLKELGVAKIRSSDLPRAAKTAQWLGDKLNIPVETTPDLRTWKTGSEVEGKKEAETIPIRKKYIKYPEEKPRGGEQFQEFVDRNVPEIKEAVEHNQKNPDAPMALMLHGHHMMAIEEMYSGKDVDPAKLDKLDKDFPPGSVSLLHVDGGSARLERVHPKGFDEKLDEKL